MSMRSDCFANRLTLAQRQELFADIQGGMKLQDAAEKVRRWSKPKRVDPPSRQAISGWHRRMKRWMNAAEVGRPEGAEFGVSSLESRVGEAAGDYEADEEVERGLRRAKLAWVRHGLEPQYVASFERNELLRRRVDLEERKHEFALRQSDLSRTLADMEERLGGLGKEIMGMADAVRADAAARKRSFEFQVGVNMMLIIIQRIKHGPDWLPEKGPDGRYHQAAPGQAPVPIETVERAVALTIAADQGTDAQAMREAAAAMRAANGGVEVKEVDNEKELTERGERRAAAAASAAGKAEGLKGGRAEANAERESRRAGARIQKTEGQCGNQEIRDGDDAAAAKELGSQDSESRIRIPETEGESGNQGIRERKVDRERETGDAARAGARIQKTEGECGNQGIKDGAGARTDGARRARAASEKDEHDHKQEQEHEAPWGAGSVTNAPSAGLGASGKGSGDGARELRPAPGNGAAPAAQAAPTSANVPSRPRTAGGVGPGQFFAL